MSGFRAPSDFPLIVAGIHLLPLLLWTIIAAKYWRLFFSERPRPVLLLLLASFSSLFAIHFAAHVALELSPNLGEDVGLHRLLDEALTMATIVAVPIGLHMFRLIPLAGERPRPLVLFSVYASALVVIVIGWGPFVIPALSFLRDAFSREVVLFGYIVAALAFGLTWARGVMLRRTWRQGTGTLAIRSPDVAIFLIALLCITGGLLVQAVRIGTSPEKISMLFFHTMMGIAFAVPFAVRMLGYVLPTFLLWITLIGVCATIFLTTLDHAFAAPDLKTAHFIGLSGLACLLLALGPGQAWLRAAIEHVLFRGRRQRHAALQEAAHAFSPELDPLECCRRACDALVRIMRFRGAAIFLDDGAERIACGAIDLPPLEQLFRTGCFASLAERALFEIQVRELPLELRRILSETDIGGITSIASPHRHWGYFVWADALLSVPVDESETMEGALRPRPAPNQIAMRAFLDQLALVLDGAQLLARAVAVERSLAHAEKLAAIGEVAARIAHEIRNPVTAARSLAQQLVREPGSPFSEEHALILGELDRIERQVAGLLRFSRREDLRLEAVDLGALVSAAVDDLRPRLDEARIEVSLELGAPVATRLDRERIRQVVINLVENARDALADANGDRRLEIHLRTDDGTARLSVSDNGPGVPEGTLVRLFEPFYSLKAQGTGLGLAIVKRTIEAHGGGIEARPADGGVGLAFLIELPLVAAG